MVINRPQLVCSIIVCFATCCFAPPPPIHHMYVDITTQTYNSLYIEFANLLKIPIEPVYDPQEVMQRYVLGPRRFDFYDEPPEWIYIHVVGEEQDRVTLAIAIDDLYLIGFSNASDHWYKFDGKLSSFKGLPGATVLPIKENYQDLIEGHANLWKVPLGKKSAIQATKQLATYDRAVTPDSELKDGLVRFVVMMCEGMRFRSIRDMFSSLSGNNWEEETFITELQAKYVVYWSILSKLLIRWELTGRLPGGPKWGAVDGLYNSMAKNVQKSINVNDANDALTIIDFLLRPTEEVDTGN
jgi:hypothetical protein